MSNRSLIDVLNVIFPRVRPSQFLTIGDHGRYVEIIPEPIRAIGVDPWPSKTDKELAPNQSIFPVTSDYFFHSVYMMKQMDVDVALLVDIMRVEQALRDMIFTEKICKRTSVIMITGTYPTDEKMTERSAIRLFQDQVGDVYKLIPIIKILRPEITISTITDVPGGVTILENLNEASTELQMKMVQSLGMVFESKLENRDTSTDMTLDEYIAKSSK